MAKVPLRGFEANAVSGLSDSLLRASDETSAAKSDAEAEKLANNGTAQKQPMPVDADLARLVAAWPTLSANVKRKILRFVL